MTPTPLTPHDALLAEAMIALINVRLAGGPADPISANAGRQLLNEIAGTGAAEIVRAQGGHFRMRFLGIAAAVSATSEITLLRQWQTEAKKHVFPNRRPKPRPLF